MNYNNYFNKRIVDVPQSGIRKLFDVAATIPDAISLGVGEPDFKTPYHIREVAIQSLIQGKTQYTANSGTRSLLKEIAFYQKNRFGLNYDPENEIVVTVGASEAIDLALRVLLNPMEEVLVPEPSYVSYSPNVVFAGGVAVPIVTKFEEGFVLTPEAIENAITPKTKAIILPYPNNPTGTILSREDLDAIADVIVKHDLIVLSDEIYAELNYSQKPHVSVASHEKLYGRTITISGFSKAFSMTGWRIGYFCAPAELTAQMLKVHQYVIMCAPTQGQIAAEDALKTGRENNYEDVTYMRDSYNQRRRLMVNGFRKMGLDIVEPLGAFYVFPSIKKLGISSEEFCNGLLLAKKVACVPGTAFGASGEGFVRCSYATSIEKLQKALKLIEEYINELKG